MFLRRLTAAILICAATSCAFAEKIVLGKLGQVTEPTKIYARPSTSSRVYYKMKAYEYIVVKAKDENWMQVLLQNGVYGYVEADTVAKLPYQVTAEQPSRSTSRYSAPLASRGSTAAAAQYATNFIGTPYVWGGDDPYRGVDCSGFVKRMFGDVARVQLPRTAAEQALVGLPVTRLQDLRAGDRVYFWDKKRGKIGHCGIYLGRGLFVHSSRGHNGVATDYLGAPKWLNILVAARRS